MVTPSGLPVLVECKLWRNPEARREVVGQILDYAKELSRWSSSDLQRAVKQNLKRDGNPLLDIVHAADPNIDEIEFNDALTKIFAAGAFFCSSSGMAFARASRRLPNICRRTPDCISRWASWRCPCIACPMADA